MAVMWWAACCAAVTVTGVLWALGGRVAHYRVTAAHSGATTSGKRASLGTAGATAARQTLAPVTLRVLSHNVWAHYIVPAPGRMRRLATLAQHIRAADPPYDVVMVQELFVMRLGLCVWSRELQCFASEMRSLGLVHTTDAFASVPGVAGIARLRVQNSGLVTFSRYPAVSPPTTINFASTGEATNTKGFTIMTVNVSGDDRFPLTVSLVNTHLDSRKWRHKQAQIDQIAAASARLDSDVVVLTGDWNVDSGSDQYSYLSAAMSRIKAGWRVEDSVLRCAGEGTMRNVAIPKPALYWHQVLGKPAPFREPTGASSEAVLDHTFVCSAPPAPPTASPARLACARVTDVAVVDARSPVSGEPASDHRGVSTCLSISYAGTGAQQQ